MNATFRSPAALNVAFIALVVARPAVAAADRPLWTGVAAVGGFAEFGEGEFAGAVRGAQFLALVGLRALVVLADAVGDAEVVAVDGHAERHGQGQSGIVGVAFDPLGAGVDEPVAAVQAGVEGAVQGDRPGDVDCGAQAGLGGATAARLPAARAARVRGGGNEQDVP